ncbi:MAG: alpha/beta hydrolase-fold protein [Ancrocorticia sp.]
MTDFSNTEAEEPLAQVDAAELRRQRVEYARSRKGTQSSPALDAAFASPAAAEELYQRLRREGAPLIEPASDDEHRLVTLLHRAPADSTHVNVVGMLAHNGERYAAPPAFAHPMRQIPGTDLWGLTVVARKDLRTTYRIFAWSSTHEPDFLTLMSDARPDPLNPNRFGGGEREPSRINPANDSESIIELEDAPYADMGRTGAAAEPWNRHWFHSELMNNTRRIWSWQPNAAPAGMLILHDGWNWTQQTRIAAILAELMDRGDIPRLLVLAVEALRGLSATELGCDDDFTDAVATEIIPWARAHWSLPPGRVILAGQSWGGLNVVYSALRRPEVAEGILSQSGSFWYSPDHDPDGYGKHGWLIEQLRDAAVVPTRFHLQVGSLEGDMVTVNRHLRDVLIAKGYEVSYAESNDNHSWYSWQFTLIDGLRSLTRDWQPIALGHEINTNGTRS